MKNLEPNKTHDRNKVSVRTNQLCGKHFWFTSSTLKKQKSDKKL